MLFAQNDKLVMIGDSITDCSRNRPTGEGSFGELGTGYVAVIHSLLHVMYPQLGVRIINMGNSGDTVRHLKDRWNEDVLQLKPDWLSIMIGINDVWRQYDQPLIKETHVYIDEYEDTLSHLVEKTHPHVKGIILMSPFHLELNRNDPMRATMDQYSLVVKKIAEKNGAMFVNIQDAFDEALKHLYTAGLAWDRVHPNMTGHMVIAKTFLNHVGFVWGDK